MVDVVLEHSIPPSVNILVEMIRETIFKCMLAFTKFKFLKALVLRMCIKLLLFEPDFKN